MSRLRSLASAVWLSGALLGLTHCDSTIQGIAVVVTLTGLPAEAQQVQVLVSVSGKGSNRDRPPLMLAPGTSRFAVALPDGTASTANITVNAVAADGCLLATGTASVQPTSGTRGYDLTLPMMPDNSCLLTVELNGEGRVDAGGQSCTSTASSTGPASGTCYMRLNRDLPVTPLARLGFKSIRGQWGGECSGDITTATCAFSLDRGKRLTVDFEPRSCSSDGVCAYPQPTGWLMRALRSERSGSSVGLYGGGQGLYSYRSSNANYAWQAQTLNPGPTQVAGLTASSSAPCVIATDGQLSCYSPAMMSFASIAPPSAMFGKITAGESNGGLYFVTDAGNIGFRNGGAATTLSQSYTGTAPLFAIAQGSGGTFAFGQGVILNLTGTSWTSVTSPTTKTLYGACVTEFSPQTGFAVGEGGVALRLQNGTWSLIETGDGRTLRSVWCSSNGGTAWAVGDGGSIRYFAVGSPSKALSPPPGQTPSFTSVTGDDSGAIVWMAAGTETLYAVSLGR